MMDGWMDGWMNGRKGHTITVVMGTYHIHMYSHDTSLIARSGNRIDGMSKRRD